MSDFSGIFGVAVALFVLIVFATAILPALIALNFWSGVLYVLLMGVLIIGVFVKVFKEF